MFIKSFYSCPEDYQHIKKYGEIHGYTKEWVQGQQWLAYKLNAQYDTVEIINNIPFLFRELTITERKVFGEVSPVRKM